MKSIQTEIIIHASVEKVWQILTDFSNYSAWNPFIRNSKGVAEVGTKLENTMHLEGQKPQIFKPTVLEVTPIQSFRWRGSLFMKGLFDGEHYFKLESIGDNKVKLIHGEKFSGIFVGMIMNMIGDATKKGFVQMNEALKARAESIHPTN